MLLIWLMSNILSFGKGLRLDIEQKSISMAAYWQNLNSYPAVCIYDFLGRACTAKTSLHICAV